MEIRLTVILGRPALRAILRGDGAGSRPTGEIIAQPISAFVCFVFVFVCVLAFLFCCSSTCPSSSLFCDVCFPVCFTVCCCFYCLCCCLFTFLTCSKPLCRLFTPYRLSIYTFFLLACSCTPDAVSYFFSAAFIARSALRLLVNRLLFPLFCVFKYSTSALCACLHSSCLF